MAKTPEDSWVLKNIIDNNYFETINRTKCWFIIVTLGYDCTIEDVMDILITSNGQGSIHFINSIINIF